jgi:4a-hydroxytetrahydrobiopterin dehydratase
LNRVSEIAEQENHHPDMEIFSWNKLKLRLSTHSVKGLTENDFILAAKIDELAR